MSAFVDVLNTCAREWLSIHDVTPEWVADLWRTTMGEYVEEDLGMKNLIKEQGVPYVGKGHSLIISYGSAGAKPVHFHGTYLEYCGVMLLTEGLRVMTPVQQEMVFQPGEVTCHEFAELLCSQANAVEELETSMAKKCSESPTVAKLIQECGYLLATTSREARSRQAEKSLAR
jgi:hypothetical protein